MGGVGGELLLLIRGGLQPLQQLLDGLNERREVAGRGQVGKRLLTQVLGRVRRAVRTWSSTGPGGSSGMVGRPTRRTSRLTCSAIRRMNGCR